MSRNLTCLSLASSLLASAAVADTPRVVADIAPLHSLVAQVMDGVGEPSLIVSPGASPHEYSLRPSEAGALQDADIVFWTSRDLTPWLADGLVTLAEDATTVELLASDGTTKLPLRENALFEAHQHGEGGHDDHGHEGEDHGDHDEHGHGHEDHGDHDHGEHDDHGHEEGHDHEHDHDHAHDDDKEDHARDSHDHAHGDYDAHAWLSPANAMVWLDTIATALASADPENGEAYRANADAARADLNALTKELDEVIAPVRGERFIVFHDAYQYFEDAFDMPAAGAITISDAADPSPARIAEIQERVASQNVTCVLSEPQFDPGIVAAVMDGTEARTGVLDPLGSDLEPGPELYPNLLRNLASALAECL